ncbi:GDP-fucose transporter 1 [Mycena sanguinolenta]|uniref:GDP-fucose transporter 1 n=1 Tax=Mycena sanguinolenta TaxID=230812 RepID=A0A8H6Y2S4_9AGAR|nr:GDP-fucose transporter 1 [Mycena sanguinolenta]
MPSDAPAERPASKVLVTAVVLFYIVAALSMVMANKSVLNVTDVPLFFLLVQLLIAVLLFGIGDVLRLFNDRLTFDLKTCRGLAPLVALNVIGLRHVSHQKHNFSNYTLKYVDASFYQVARGLVLPFTVAASYTILSVRPSVLILVSCAIVTAGFFCGVLLDGTPISLVGVAFGVASSSITALASVTIKQSLKVVDGSTILLAWYGNLLSSIVLMPIVLLAGEGPGVIALFSGTSSAAGGSELKTFLWGSLITGGVGFLMSIAGLLSIKVTSPITHMISSAVRGVVQSFLGMWYFGDVISSGRASSIAIVLGGSIYYTWVKHKETEAAAAYEKVSMDDLETGKREGPDSPE